MVWGEKEEILSAIGDETIIAFALWYHLRPKYCLLIDGSEIEFMFEIELLFNEESILSI